MGHLEICVVLIIASITIIQADQLIFRNNIAANQNQWNTPQTQTQEMTKPPTVRGNGRANAASGVPQIFYASPNYYQQQQQQFDEVTSDFISTKVLEFAHNVGQQLADEQIYLSKNEIFSPVSVISALSLLLLGAKGKSYQELKQLFGFDNSYLQNNPSKFHEEFGKMLEDLQRHDENPMRMRKKVNWKNTDANNNIRVSNLESRKPYEHILRVANGIFSQTGYSLNLHYRYVVYSIYHSELIQLDFQRKSSEARDMINGWVSHKTFGKINNIINGEISKGTNVIMASALYFKGFWENTFFDKATTLDNFYPDGAQQPSVKVQMMATGGFFPFYDSVEYDCRIIGLPYQGNLTTMYVIQPNFSTRAKLRELQKILSAQRIEEIISKMAKRTAVVAFPKMHFVHNINMKNVLQRLGVSEIFNNGFSDLSLIGNTVQPTGQTMIYRSPQHGLIFNRFGAEENNETITTTTEDPMTNSTKTIDDQPGNKTKRQTVAAPIIDRNIYSLQYLESQRFIQDNYKSDLFVDDILHKVDFDINEQGTEAAAATVTYLKRSGTDVLFRADTPFLLLIRHDPTKLALFYGIINEPAL